MLCLSLSLSLSLSISLPIFFLFQRVCIPAHVGVPGTAARYRIDVTFFHATPETLTLDLDVPKIFTPFLPSFQFYGKSDF